MTINRLLGLPDSHQKTTHARLDELLQRYRDHSTQRPVADHTKYAFDAIMPWIEHQQKPIILDACCGRGDSSIYTALRYPDHCVLGIDKSIARLSKLSKPYGLTKLSGLALLDKPDNGIPDNLFLAQADLRDFYRLAHQDNLKLVRHQIYYPNPYPKPSQVQKRWHAMPVFNHMIALGGVFVLRTNFKIYAEEWVKALDFHGFASAVKIIRNDPTETSVSLFEKKYRERGHILYQVRVQLALA